MRSQRFLRILSYIVAAILLVVMGWQAHCWYQLHYVDHKHRRVTAQGFHFTSPLLDVELPEGYNINQEPIPFKYKITKFVQTLMNSGKAQRISVYFRDLQDGPWFGINEKQEFDPASMMKVPVMIAWLKRAEKDPHELQRIFTYDGKNDMPVMQNIKSTQSIRLGHSYSLEELLTYMLKYSDNNASLMLLKNLKEAELNEVLDGMDIVNDANKITVHGYSGFFRILYNASFLNREMSEKALQLLSLQDFPQGISAGVPKGTVVASKFGENASGIGAKEKQLHEFGIVYHPKGPYILGIMTQGRDFERQAEIIRDISKMIYEAVDSTSVLGGVR